MQVDLCEPIPQLASGATNLTLAIMVDNIRQRPSGVLGLRTTVDFRVAGLTIATGSGQLQIVERRVLARMRRGAVRSDRLNSRLSRPLSASVVGRRHSSDVVLSRLPGRLNHHVWSVRIDPTHPLFFDHPVDHVPGMLMMESARQVARIVAGMPTGDLTHFDGNFERFLELNQTALLYSKELVREAERVSLLITVQQGDMEAARMSATIDALGGKLPE